MGKTLVIAEKPIAGKTIAKVLECRESRDGYIEGEHYVVTWADGHLIGKKYPEQMDEKYKKWNISDLPIEIDLEKILYVLPEHEKQFEIIKKLIHREDIDMLINAGDAGREGYLIQYWIYKMAENKKPVKVLWAASLTEGALQKAFSSLHEQEEFAAVLEEGLARAEADYLMGINYSRLLTGKLSQDLTLPYGRCMTTLLNMIVMRDREIAAFQPETTYSIEVQYKNGRKGTLLGEDQKKKIFLTEPEAEEYLKKIQPEGTCVSIKGKETEQKGGYPLNLQTLQKYAGQKFGYTPAETLETAQKLYERYQLITYPRTDTRYLGTDMKTIICKYRDNCIFGKFGIRFGKWKKDGNDVEDMFFDDGEITDHHAILPDINPKAGYIYQSLPKEEKNIYDAVVYHFLAMFCRPYIFQSKQTDILNAGLLFRTNEQQVTDKGYKGIFVEQSTDAPEELLEIEPGETILLSGASIKQDITSCPTRYNVGNIIDAMESWKIGTPATMASTIEKLVNAKYPFLILRKGKYISTPLGRKYIEMIPEELKNLELSMLFETQLKEIELLQTTRQSYCSRILEDIKNNINRIEEKKMSFKPYVAVTRENMPGRKTQTRRRF